MIERYAPAAGGVEGAAHALVAELARRGLAPAIVCRETRAEPPPGVALEVLGAISRWQPLRLASFSRRAEAATRGRFDVVHGFARTRHQDIYRAGGGSHAAYLENVYRHPRLQRLSPRHFAILTIEEAVFRDPHQIIQCNSQLVARELAARYAIAPERLVTIVNGVDTERFHPRLREADRARVRDELGLDGAVALFVGSGFARKGLDRAIRGLAACGAKGTLVVAGRGDPTPYARLARELGIGHAVRFAGERRDVERLHAAADLFVLPTRYDPFSNACLEAMASGLAVATTPTNGAAELIEPGRSGFLCDEDFSPAFARLADREALAAMGRTARAVAEQHTWAAHADRVLELYERVAR